MQALYSGFSYVCSEGRRATQPVIDTLAPILPTFGCGEAAVKQSVGSCIHELEAVAISRHHVNKGSMGWSQSFSNIKKIVLYPLSDPAGTLKAEDKCRESTAVEVGILVNVTSNINQQLESWSIPFRFEVSDHRKDTNEVLTKASKNCLTSSSKKEKVSLFFGHCDDLKENGAPVGGYQGQCHVALRANAPKGTVAHELAHVFSPHIFDAIPLTSLHPDLMEAMCDPVAHGDELITSLSYWSHCRNAGFPDTWAHHLNSRGQWGPIDLTLAKLATHKKRDDIHAQIHAEGVDQSYEWIRQNYGERAAEQFTASFAKSVFIHSMSAIVARTVRNKALVACFRALIHVFGNLLHLGMLGQLSSPTPWQFIGQFCVESGLMGRAAKVLVGVIGEAAILRSFVQVMRGNSDAMVQLVYATCGTAAGNLFCNLILGFIDMCAPADEEQRQAYLGLTSPTTMYGVLFESTLSISAAIQGVDPKAVAENMYSRLPTIVQRIVTIDTAVADVIEQYVSLRVMTSWIWKKDQQKADAQVQASVDRLSETLDEVKTKFGPSGLPRIPANTRSFRPTQPVPPLDLDRAVEDDPLLATDVAAVTGVGRAQVARQQKKLGQKKQQ